MNEIAKLLSRINAETASVRELTEMEPFENQCLYILAAIRRANALYDELAVHVEAMALIARVSA